MSTQSWIYVDDTDPDIHYEGPWTPKTFSSTGVNEDFSLVPTPVYETGHSLDVGRGMGGNISFKYTGTFLSASFIEILSGAPIVLSCTIDGIDMLQLTSPYGVSQCTEGDPEAIRSGTHEFTLSIVLPAGGLVVFDGLTYLSSSQEPPADTDAIFLEDDLTLTGSPEEFDFDFTGYSMGLYLSFNSDKFVPTRASYSVDGQQPVNFTVTNPTTIQNYNVAPQLVVQTPRFAYGNHHFHADFFGASDSVPIQISQVIVQKRTTPQDIALDVIPPVSHESSPQAPPVSAKASVPSFAITSSTHLGPLSTVQFVILPSHQSTTTSSTILPILPSDSSIGQSFSTLPSSTFLTTPSYAPPSISQSASPNKSNTAPHRIRVQIIAAVISGVIVMMVLALGLLVRRHRSRIRALTPDSTRISDAFRDLPISDYRHLTKKAAAGEERVAGMTELRHRSAPPNTHTLAPTRRPPRIVVHEDSGDAIAQSDVQSDLETIELPPTYNMIGGPIVPSRRLPSLSGEVNFETPSNAHRASASGWIP